MALSLEVASLAQSFGQVLSFIIYDEHDKVQMPRPHSRLHVHALSQLERPRQHRDCCESIATVGDALQA